MLHHTPLIATIVAGLVAAFAMGALAHRLKVSPVAGYLFAGVLIGPFTPGYVADGKIATELAELGVILLMFGVGLHFSLKDLMSVRRIAVPGALVQMGSATAMGVALALMMGWTVAAGLVFGLALSVASTVVLLRALQSENLVETERGRIAVGWLIVEDLAMVMALVLLPVFAQMQAGNGAGGTDLLSAAIGTLVKVAGFAALMLIVGRRVIPWILHWTAHTGSRELFRLAVLAIALGVAFGAAYVFQVSFALGAFFAGMILGETQLSRRAAEESLPLRDAFAVLFFVSVGMLFDPSVILEQPVPLLATVAIIIFGKSLAAYAIIRVFGYPKGTALTVSASLAQIGEFSFILAGLGATLGILPDEARDLILAGAILSILANPFIFGLVIRQSGEAAGAAPGASPTTAAAAGRVVLVGYGRVGKSLARRLRAARTDFVLIEEQSDRADEARAAGYEVVTGNATQAQTLEQTGLADAGRLLVAIPEGFEAGGVVHRARDLNPGLTIVARAHSVEEVEDLRLRGADHVVLGEEAIALRMLSGASAAPA
ncbi:MAG: YbaL family putative K(+) efflux transporter [Phenylobacterium sp.]